MDTHIRKPRQALNKAYLKVRPIRSEMDRFKANLIHLLDHINESESEEHHKNLVADFLKKTWYDPNHFINTKGRNDQVIHNGNKDSTVGSPAGIKEKQVDDRYLQDRCGHLSECRKPGAKARDAQAYF